MSTKRTNPALPDVDSFLYSPKQGKDPLRQAYEKRMAMHAGMRGQAVDAPHEVATLFSQLQDMPRKGKTSAYIHIPFCETKCVYCGFYNLGYREELSSVYVDALIAEMQQESETLAVGKSPVHALYLGGGTPTSLEARDLKRLLVAAKTYLPLANDCEITVEGRIHNFDQEKMEACLDGGTNRFSLGVQSFDTTSRQQLGRVCSREEVFKALEILHSMDNSVVVVDLIYGLPGQSLQDWEEEIRTFLETNLDGVDLYQLSVYPSSTLRKKLDTGELPPVATIGEQGAMFAAGVAIMEGAAARRLSIAHWGVGLRERNIYNIFAKSKYHCLAFGAGGGGFLHGHSYYINNDYKSYMQARKEGRKDIIHMSRPLSGTRITQCIIPQMEQGYLHLGRLAKETGIHGKSILAPYLERCEQAGLITRESDLVRLTVAGQFWHANVAQGIVEWIYTVKGEDND